MSLSHVSWSFSCLHGSRKSPQISTSYISLLFRYVNLNTFEVLQSSWPYDISFSCADIFLVYINKYTDTSTSTKTLCSCHHYSLGPWNTLSVGMHIYIHLLVAQSTAASPVTAQPILICIPHPHVYTLIWSPPCTRNATDDASKLWSTNTCVPGTQVQSGFLDSYGA